MRVRSLALAALLGGCGGASSDRTELPPAPSPTTVQKLVKQVSAAAGPEFQPIFVCDVSQGRSFQPSRLASDWASASGPEAIVLAIDNQGALELLRQTDDRLVAATADGGIVIPVKFDPVAGDIAVAVVYTKTGVSETYAFSTFEKSPSFLTWTVNIPQSGARPGGRGVQAFIAQCVERPITPVQPSGR